MATELTENQATSNIAAQNGDVANREIHEQLGRKYSAGFVTAIESESLSPGLDEDVVRAISARKNEPEWMTQWRLAAYRHWLTMTAPHWAKLQIAEIDFQAISYYSAPKGPKYKSLDEVPQELLDTYEKLGVPLHERARLAGVAVDAVFDSVSVGTTFRKELAEKGVIFCSMSEAIREYPELVKQYVKDITAGLKMALANRDETMKVVIEITKAPIAVLDRPPDGLRAVMVPRDGIEPPTLRFSVACSTN